MTLTPSICTALVINAPSGDNEIKILGICLAGGLSCGQTGANSNTLECHNTAMVPLLADQIGSTISRPCTCQRVVCLTNLIYPVNNTANIN